MAKKVSKAVRKEARKRNRKGSVARFIYIFIFLAGLGIALYPTVSNWLAQHNQIVAVQSYDTQITNLSKDQIKVEWDKAKAYNKKLQAGIVTDPFSNVNNVDPFTEYDKTLAFDDGVMGYVSIPKINVKIPIYHGVADDILQKGVGHIKATALPVGGKGTHSVLSAHSGLPEARLFTDLVDMEKGDYFFVYVLDKTMAYKVDDISVVSPDDVSKLQPVKGKDYVTLLTCTPIGINDHRLLVRGIRCPLPDEKEMEMAGIIVHPWWELGLAGIVLLIIAMILDHRKKKRQRRLAALEAEMEEEQQQNDDTI